MKCLHSVTILVSSLMTVELSGKPQYLRKKLLDISRARACVCGVCGVCECVMCVCVCVVCVGVVCVCGCVISIAPSFEKFARSFYEFSLPLQNCTWNLEVCINSSKSPQYQIL